MSETLYDEMFEGIQRAKEVYRAEAHRLARELEYMKTLATNAVREYPVASGLYKDTDGQAGYGSLKAMRLYLGMSPENSRDHVGSPGEQK
jgi:hypothetical protein